MIQPLRLSLAIAGILFAAHLSGQPAAQNNTLRGRVLYQSSGNKPAIGVRVAEPDANPAYSVDNGDYRLTFQSKRNGATLAVEIGPDTRDGKKIELVNEKELKSAKLPASAEEILEIIVCPAGQRDIAAQKYYRILRTTADRELEKKKKEVTMLLEQKEKDYQKISDLFALIDKMQTALDSAKIHEQAFNIASINLDRASQMVKDAVRKIEEENDVEGALKILNAEALDTAYEHASAIKRQGEAIVKKADVEIRQVIEGYEFKISLLEPQFKYGEMAECYEKLAGIYEKEGYDHEKLTDTYAWVARYCGFNGNYQKALEFELKALAIRGKELPVDHPDLAKTYGNLAVTYGDLGEYQKALEFNLKDLAIREKALLADQPELAWSYSNLAITYGYLGEYQKALEHFLKALAILENTLPASHSDLSLMYNNLAAAYGNLGEYQKALEYNLKDQSIKEKMLLANHPDLALSYNNLAFAYTNLGEYQRALEFYLKAMDIWEKVLPAEHFYLAVLYDNLAYNYGELGEYQKALEISFKGLSILEKTLPADHPDLAKSYSILTYIYGKLGNYQKSLEFEIKVLAIREKSLPADHPDLITTYFNIARGYRDVGEYKNGIEYAQKIIRIGETSNPKHPDLNSFYANLAFIYLKSRQFPEAKAALEKSESLKEAEGVYRGWAMYYALHKKRKQAIENLQKAVSLGFKNLKWFEIEPDLKNIRKEKGYKDLVEQLKKQ